MAGPPPMDEDSSYDEFARLLLEEAKRFYEKSTDTKEPAAQVAFRHATLLLAFSALEAHINGIADELLLRDGFSVLDKSLLSERDFELKDGTWQLSKRFRMFRIEDRLSFVLLHSTDSSAIGDFAWWPDLRSALNARNALVHPRSSLKLGARDIERYISAVVNCLDALYRASFGRKHPATNRGTSSTMTF